MSSVPQTSGTSGSGSTDTSQKTTTPKKDLDKDAFLKLLVTQLRYQDPTQPMQDREFIAQMAQFSSLEQMTNISTGLKDLAQVEQSANDALAQMQLTSQALSLVGHNIEAVNPDYDAEKDPEDKKTITGTVTKVQFEDGIPKLMLGDVEVSLASVIAIK